MLLEAIKQHVGAAGQVAMHLYTENEQNFYGKREWGTLREDKAEGESVTIVSRSL